MPESRRAILKGANVATTLELRWTVSRGRDTYGYNICTLYADGEKVARCNGGGYDMEGTCFGSFLAHRYADRLVKLTPADMPAQSHWEPDWNACACFECATDRALKDLEPVTARREEGAEWPKCPECGAEMERQRQAGKRIDDGRSFYGLTFHDPDFDPSKAVIGADCSDRTLSNKGNVGMTVGEAEAAGESLGLERYQAFYRASSPVPTERHRVPSINGACGKSSVERIAEAIGVRFEYVPVRGKNRSVYILHDARA